MSTSPTTKSTSLISESVLLAETSSDTFSANYVIHAYEQGHKKGMRDKMIELETDVKSQFLNNRDFTINTVNSLIVDFIKDGVMSPMGWIKSEGTDDFDVIIAIPQEKYLSPDFDKYYIKANELETQSNNPAFHLNIRFINGTKQINEEKLFCDGYKLKFEVKASPKS
ncbi:hypothetical protein [Mucilaginibacter lappiensis]|uniref:Nucleotidyltransferase domain-containing protein n=1 Tax=Mucilaginibacter lappiensis TaxID=354630 RepID=A0A841JT22_9SPHI|nr:hypothetical protein [Mucilaginibacter lappiensis]MBB6131425.1 hypothetical protein [Mucilaginibacter lappiensis]